MFLFLTADGLRGSVSSMWVQSLAGLLGGSLLVLARCSKLRARFPLSRVEAGSQTEESVFRDGGDFRNFIALTYPPCLLHFLFQNLIASLVLGIVSLRVEVESGYIIS